MITIIDYGMGNLGSIYNMFKRIGVRSLISSDPNDLLKASKLVLPGVGEFDSAMQIINDKGYSDIIIDKVKTGVPILGICLGMQLLTNGSEEGKIAGLGLIDAKTIKFKSKKLKIPHMGWNTVSLSNTSKLTENLPDEPRFYFVHSYYVKVKEETNSILKTNYGTEFDSGIWHKNVFGVQFHPEKSHKYGMRLLENFSNIK